MNLAAATGSGGSPALMKSSCRFNKVKSGPLDDFFFPGMFLQGLFSKTN